MKETLPGKLEIRGKKYSLVTLDFETFYSKEYTLSGSMNTSEYVRDERFHAHGVAIKKGTGKTHWFTREKIREALSKIDWSQTALICHNTPFDGFILSEHYGVVPEFYIDTMAMSRACRGHHLRHNLDAVAKSFGHQGKVKRGALADTKGKSELTKEEEKNLGAYAIDDVDDTFRVFWDLHPYMPDDELGLVDLTVRMFCDPVLEVDTDRVQRELEKEVGAKYEALKLSGVSAEELMSNVKFAKLLESNGATLPTKISPSTGKSTYAFAKSDLAFKEMMQAGNSKIRALCEARLRVKSTIGETRALRFLEAGKDGRKLPILLNYSGAHTHRWTGGNKMNLQNLVRGGELRRSILAPKGYVILVADASQIEARILAFIAEQMDIVNAFANKQDVYKLMASAIYNKPVSEITKDERFIGKVCVLGLGYGMGAERLQKTLLEGALGPPVQISLTECVQIVAIYRQKNFMIREFWRKMDYAIQCMSLGTPHEIGVLRVGKGFIQLPNDMFLQYYGLHNTVETSYNDSTFVETTYLTMNGRAKLYGGLLAENVTQALARIVIAKNMLTIADSGVRIASMTHDEIIAVCPESEADTTLKFIIDTMSTPPDWAPTLPLAAEGGYDYCYSK